MFESARLKVERANHHIRDLEAQFRAFVETNPYRLVLQPNPDTGQQSIQVNFGVALSATFGLTIGDALHNLHCALDHLMWELIGHDGGTQNRHTAFPFGDNRISFEARCGGIETPSQAVRDLLKSMEAFPAGKGDALYSLHLLNNSDKHSIITPMMRVAQIPDFTVVSPEGVILQRYRSNIWATGTAATLGLVKGGIPDGSTLQIDEKAKPALGIFFGAITGFPMQPVVPALSKFRTEALRAVEVVSAAVSRT